MQPVDWKQVALDADRERGLESAEAEMQRTGDLHLYISKLKQEVQAQRTELAKRRTLLNEQKSVLESCIPLVEARRLAFKSLMKGTALERLSNMVSDNRR
ncbi:MAG: uncharacterized protein KVP18_003840 [Porospora cf. gigantea A]|uniref:uncharacterized protein n=1 Tax=Porospora cf. gigantea A TaxID=2853593 RepID=UPI0035593C03|nr:MAG: hypothetical protein KVP18_003840 [Porospora cf. gigantea A]